MVLRRVETHWSPRTFYKTQWFSEELKPTGAVEHSMELSGSPKS